MFRSGRINIGAILALAAAIYGALFLRGAFPVLWTKMQVDEVTKLTLLEWRDKSQRKGFARMQYELEQRNVPSDIVYVVDSCGERGCCLFEREKERHVDCWWDEDINLPFTEKWWTIEFSVHKYLDEDDHLHTVEEQ